MASSDLGRSHHALQGAVAGIAMSLAAVLTSLAGSFALSLFL